VSARSATTERTEEECAAHHFGVAIFFLAEPV
jgi:hypothetical protein